MSAPLPNVIVEGIPTPVAYLASGLACPPFTQSKWYFDFVNGDDNNDGMTASTPIKTWMHKPNGSPGEYISRTGFNPYIDIIVDFYIQGDLPATDMVGFFGVPGPNCQIKVHGTPVVKRKGTITGKQDRSPGGHGIVSTTDTTPIVLVHDGTTIPTNNDFVTVYNHLVNTNANSENAVARTWPIAVISPTSFSLTGSIATGAGNGGATGTWSANQRDEILDAAVPSWAPDTLQLMEVQTSTTRTYEGNVVSGPTRGWVAKAEVGPIRAAMSIMSSKFFVPANPYTIWPGPFPVGANYSILQLPKMGAMYIDPRMQAAALVNYATPNFMELLDFTTTLVMSTISGGWQYYDCSWDRMQATGSILAGSFFNCLARSGISWTEGSTIVFGLAAPGSFISGTGTLAAYGLMMQGPATQIFADGSVGSGNGMVFQNHHASYGLGIYDCDAPIYIGNNATLSNESTIYGTGITTSVVHIDQGGRAVDNNTYAIARPYCVAAGAPSDIILNNQLTMNSANPVPQVFGGGFVQAYSATLPLTFANLFKSFANGGFEGRVYDLDSPQTSYEMEHP